MRRQTSVSLGADGKEDAMRLIQEIGFSLMLVIGVSMILYDVLLSRARTPAREREMEAKNVFREKPAR
jgi:TRAP-type mannitol/chloroaromatic compound transport system permease small subunit